MLFKLKEKEQKYINPRFRAYGKARIDIAKRAKTRQDWDELWKGSTNPFPFTWGESWKQCVEYKVDDFAAEVGFFVDILGLPVNAFDPAYAMFTSPGGDFFIGVVPTPKKGNSTPKDAIRLQFMVKEIMETTKELERRGVRFEQQPQPCQPGSSLHIAYFHTPHGIPVDLWGYIDKEDIQDENGPNKDEFAGHDVIEESEIVDNENDDFEDQFDDLNDGEEDGDQDAINLKEAEEEDLQLEILMDVKSEELSGAARSDELEINDDTDLEDQDGESLEETPENNEEIEAETPEIEESRYEYIYEEDPVRDWHIN
jgi:catechol 2,3-dioxygenase-like lactoylglutathione lyase family enzyme